MSEGTMRKSSVAKIPKCAAIQPVSRRAYREGRTKVKVGKMGTGRSGSFRDCVIPANATSFVSTQQHKQHPFFVEPGYVRRFDDRKVDQDNSLET